MCKTIISSKNQKDLISGRWSKTLRVRSSPGQGLLGPRIIRVRDFSGAGDFRGRDSSGSALFGSETLRLADFSGQRFSGSRDFRARGVVGQGFFDATRLSSFRRRNPSFRKTEKILVCRMVCAVVFP